MVLVLANYNYPGSMALFLIRPLEKKHIYGLWNYAFNYCFF